VVALAGGRVVGVTEKPHDAASNAVSMGIYAFNRDVFSFIESSRLTVPDVLNGMIEAGVPVQAMETQSDWRNVVYPWDILYLNDAILRHLPGKSSGVVETNVTINGAVSLGKDTVVRSNSYLVGPLVIGDGCEIGPNVCLFPATSVADNVVIGAGSVLSNSVIGDDVNIGPGCIIQDSVIDRNTVIGARFTAASGDADVSVDGEYHRVALGAMLGEDCTLGPGVTAQPGTVAGNYSKVRAHKLIAGRLPDGSVFV